jgi:hypothetical protein
MRPGWHSGHLRFVAIFALKGHSSRWSPGRGVGFRFLTDFIELIYFFIPCDRPHQIDTVKT